MRISKVMVAIGPGVERSKMLTALAATCTFLLGATFYPGDSTDAAASTEISGQDDLDNARALAQKEYGAHPSDPQSQMALARLMRNADSARVLYKKVISRDNAPDSLKAEAFYRLACMSYMAANYLKAETQCASACSLDNKETYERLFARSAALSGHDASERRLKTRKTDSLQTVPDTGKKIRSPSEKGEKKAAMTAFYLQVAAFAEIENAQALKKDLLRLFSKVLIKEGNSRGKNIFRVRIGPFAGEKEAQAYGDSALVKNKISFRLVED